MKEFNDINDMTRQMKRDFDSWVEEAVGRISRNVIKRMADEGLTSPDIKQAPDGSVTITYVKGGTTEEVKKYHHAFEHIKKELNDNIDNIVGGA